MSDAPFTEFTPSSSFAPAIKAGAEAIAFKPKYQVLSEPERVNSDSNDGRAIKIAEAYESGFSDGYKEALSQSENLQQQENNLANALSALRCADQEKLSQLFWQSTLSLVKKTIGETPVDEALLLERCSAVISLIDKQTEQPQLHVAPDDFELVSKFPCDAEIISDPEIVSGSVRLVQTHGTIEAGGVVLLAAIEDAIDCTGQPSC